MIGQVKQMKTKFKNFSILLVAGILVIGGVILAGSLTPSGDTSTPTMYTLEDVYQKLNLNTFTPSTHTVSTTSLPTTGTMHTLTEIWNKIPTIVASTVATGTTILGIPGTAKVVTGTGTGDPATTDQVITDYYAYDANGAVIQGAASAGATLTWEAGAGTAMNWNAGTAYCGGLSTDQAIVWRLPSPNELVAAYNSGVPGGFAGGSYWSGTTNPDYPDYAYYVNMNSGLVSRLSKTAPGFYVRCVH